MPDLLSPRHSPHHSPRQHNFLTSKDEVQALPDIIPKLNHFSNTLKKTYDKRSKCHEITLIEYEHGLKYINSENVETILAKVCQTTLERINELERDISEELLDPLEHHQDFESVDIFNEAWTSILTKLDEVFQVVGDMEKELIAIEKRRLSMIKSHLTVSFDIVKAVGHWNEQKICCYFDAESEMINRMSVSNYEQFTDLTSKLKLSTSHKMVKWRARWEVCIMNWKDQIIGITLNSFDDLINSEKYRVPPDNQDLHNIVLKEQHDQDNIILDEYKNIVKTLPYNKDKLENFSNTIHTILSNKENIYMNFIENTCIIFDELEEKVNSRFASLRSFLEKEADCQSTQFDKIFKEYYSDGSKSYEKWVNQTKEYQCREFNDNLQHMAEVHSNMLQFLHSICNMWEGNQVKIKSKETDALDSINNKRVEHQKCLAKVESDIDNLIQRLKHCKDVPTVNSLWAIVSTKLEKLKKKYYNFELDVREFLVQYPNDCLKEIEGYENEIFKVIDIEEKHNEEDFFLEIDGKRFVKLFIEDITQTVENLMHPIVQQITNIIKDEARKVMIQHILTSKTDLHHKSTELVQKNSSELVKELKLRLSLHEPRERIIKSEFDKRIVDIENFKILLDMYYDSAQMHETNIKSNFEKINDGANKLIKTFDVDLSKINDMVLKETRSSRLQKRKEDAYKMYMKYDQKLQDVFQEGQSTLENEINEMKRKDHEFVAYAEKGIYDFGPESKDYAEFHDFNTRMKSITPHTKRTLKQIENIKMKQLSNVMNLSTAHYKHCLFSLYFQEKRSELLARCRLQIKSAVSFCDKDIRDLEDNIKKLTSLFRKKENGTAMLISNVIDQGSSDLDCINVTMKKVINYLNYRCSPLQVQHYSSLMELTEKYEQFAKSDGEFSETLEFCKEIMEMTKMDQGKFSNEDHDMSNDNNWIVSRSDVEKRFIRGRLGCIFGVGANILDVPSNPWSGISATVTRSSTKSFWLKNNPQELQALSEIRDVKRSKQRNSSPYISKNDNHNTIVRDVCKKLRASIGGSETHDVKCLKRPKISVSWGEAMQHVTEGKSLPTGETSRDISQLLPHIDLKYLKYEATRRNSGNQFNMQSALTLAKTVELLTKTKRRSSVVNHSHKIPIYDFVTMSDNRIHTLMFNPVSFFKLNTRNYSVDDLGSNIVSIVEKVKFYLLHVQEDFIISCEIFYRQKHMCIKHPDKVCKNVDTSVKEFKETVENYLVQMRNHSVKCIEKIKNHLSKLHELQRDIPRVLFSRIKEEFVTNVLDRSDSYKVLYERYVLDSEGKREGLWALLGPKLSHPQQRDELERICKEEKERRKKFGDLLKCQRDEILLYLSERSRFVVAQISNCTKKLFECADTAIQPENIRRITSEGENLLQIKSRLRDTMMNRNENKNNRAQTVVDTNATFSIHLPNINTEGSSESGKMNTRNTLLHQAVITARDESMAAIEKLCAEQVDKVEKLYVEYETSEKQWEKRWNIAVNDIKVL